MAEKRARTANYSLEEKNLLLQLVQKHKNVVENKKTDAVSNIAKENTWKKIAFEFNSVAPSNVSRDWASLKKAYSNIKKDVRKEVANEKFEIIKTGSGPNPRKKYNPLQEIALATMNDKTVYGLTNEFDGDTIPLENEGTLSDVFETVCYLC